MSRNPAPRPDNPEQFRRFQELAREVGADEQGKDFDRVLGKVAKRNRDKARKRKPSK